MDPDNDDIEAETNSVSELEDKIFGATENLKTIIDDFQKATEQNNAVIVADVPNYTENNISVHLPKLQMEKFDGQPLKWQQFWDSFDTTIHSNHKLSVVDKFKYLRSFLTGDALRHVAGYSLTAQNYQTVVESLTERFGNKQLAVFSHFEAMLALPVATYETSQLQRTFDECETHIRSLIALGLHEDTFGQVFTPIILSKLPTFVKMDLYRKNGADAWTLKALREFLKQEIRIRDMSQRSFVSKTEKQTSYGRSHKNTSQGTTSSLLAESTAQQKQGIVKCSFCRNQHYTDECKEFSDLQSRKEKIMGRCFRCLSSKHLLPECTRKIACFHCKSTSHHRALCPKKYGKQSVSDSSAGASLTASAESEMDSINTTLLSHGETVIMQTALTSVRAGNQTEARLLFDTGCTRTFITSDLATKIKARSKGEEQISIAGFNATKRKTSTYKIVEFDVIQADGTLKTLTANVTQTISCPIQKQPLDIKSYPVVQNLRLAEPIVTKTESVNIDVLIGSDYYYDFIGCERIKCTDGLLFLSSTLGFIATGRLDSPKRKSNLASSLLLDTVPEADIPIERYWSLEDIGVKSQEASNDDEALASFNNSVCFKDNRYHVSWPWKDKEPEFPDNYQLALGRLKSLYKRIGGDKTLLEQYDKTIKDQLAKDVIEESPVVPSSNLVHYIPHHAVLTPQKTTTKLRVVYDASAKMSKTTPSLNECLHRGPVILDNLCGLLIRFRLQKIGLVSDIEKAFLQVGLNEEAREVTRFLWLKNCSQPPTPDNIVIYRFCRVPFGFISSPFLLGATVLHHMKLANTPTSIEVSKNLYVDNLISGKNKVSEANEFYIETKELFKKASMNIREWFSNSKEVRDSFKPEDCGKTETTKVLGLEWDTSQDTLKVNSVAIQPDAVNTKRLVLKHLAKVFDPCGFFAAVTVSCKMLMQQIWKDSFQWDDELPKDIVDKWIEISKDLARISENTIPRCILPQDLPEEFQIHCFCDASTKAYAAVVYLRMKSKNGITTRLLFAKSRVAPLKMETVPRLELMAALIGTRLCRFVEDSMRIPIAGRFVWSDSQCVLHWIMSGNVTTTFVKNRVNEIKKDSSIHFRYVPTDVNPADIASRGCTLNFLMESDLWWNGPRFLSRESLEWPNNIVPSLKKQTQETQEVDLFDKIHINVTVEPPPKFDPLVEFERFSKLIRLYRTVAWMFRFIHNVKRKEKNSSSVLSATEIKTAEEFCIRSVQQEEFHDTLSHRPKAQPLSELKQLQTFKDDNGFLRCDRRLNFADLPENTKYPFLLPKSHHFTHLVIKDCHEKLNHGGPAHTLSELRKKFWIPHGRSQVRKVLNSCMHCKLRQGGSFQAPKFPPLPEFRVTKQRPFQSVGLDYLGPLHIKNSSPEQPLQKVWICLFTCAVTRAVHLEVAEQLTAEQFLFCLRRFTARYGKPNVIVSDNATQFHAVQNTLAKIVYDIEHSQTVQDHVASLAIEWKFITEMSPWMGGFYERMVGIVKRCMKNCLDSRCVSLSELQTIIAEVAGIVNSRPLIYVGAEITDVTLTPAHFLGGPFPLLSGINPNEQDPDFSTTTPSKLVCSYKRLQNILDSFWKQFQNQYLLSLRGMKYCHGQTKTTEYKPVIGSIVQMKDSGPRNLWKIGKITSLSTSNDGAIRTATVELSNKKKFNRPLKYLFPLELETEITKPITQPVNRPTTERTPLPRKAAKAAIEKIKSQLASESVEDSD